MLLPLQGAPHHCPALCGSGCAADPGWLLYEPTALGPQEPLLAAAPPAAAAHRSTVSACFDLLKTS